MGSPSIADRKIRLIELLAQLEDETVLALIELLLTEGADRDWANALSDKEKQDIAEGLADLEAGNTESLDDFKARMKAKYP